MKSLFAFLLFLSFSIPSFSKNVDLKNVQIKCSIDNSGTTVFVGNDTKIDSMNAQILVYESEKLVERSKQKLSFKKESARFGDLLISSSKTQIDVRVFMYPMMWNAGSVNGKSAKCHIDSEFFSTLRF